MKILLIIIELLVAITAFGGGIGLVFFNGLDMPLEHVADSFGSYLIPGLILFFVVGGTNLAAAISVIKNSQRAVEWSVVAGFGLQIWLFTELYLTRSTSYLQIIYFILATLILILSLTLERRGRASLNR